VKSYIIGDIHGCLSELACLLESLPLESQDHLVFLGDYVDRGPDARGVISYLIDWQQRDNIKTTFLKGNHEDMFLSFLGFPGNYGDMFLYNGGGATLASYGIPAGPPSPGQALSQIPPNHLNFLKTLTVYHLLEPVLCVHAGIHPRKPLEQQVEEEMLWIRDEFVLHHHSLPYTVLFGHTPQKEVLFHLPYKIGLDTGLVYGNKLSCLEIREKVLFQIPRGGRKVHCTSIREKWPRVATHPTT